jgi:hypothetical protein
LKRLRESGVGLRGASRPAVAAGGPAEEVDRMADQRGNGPEVITLGRIDGPKTPTAKSGRPRMMKMSRYVHAIPL